MQTEKNVLNKEIHTTTEKVEDKEVHAAKTLQNKTVEASNEWKDLETKEKDTNQALLNAQDEIETANQKYSTLEKKEKKKRANPANIFDRIR
jgi:hypothetical protein